MASTPNVVTRPGASAVAARLALMKSAGGDADKGDEQRHILGLIRVSINTAAEMFVSLVEAVPAHDVGRLIYAIDSLRQASVAFEDSVRLASIKKD